jgi:hypothetical protein
MNAYITLDGKKYKTPQKSWTPTELKPATVRVTLLGAMDATYAPATILVWQGEIEVPFQTSESGFGTISDLETSFRKRQLLSFQDHFAVATYQADVSGQMVKRSNTPKWDGTSNKFFVVVTIKAIA